MVSGDKILNNVGQVHCTAFLFFFSAFISLRVKQVSEKLGKPTEPSSTDCGSLLWEKDHVYKAKAVPQPLSH